MRCAALACALGLTLAAPAAAGLPPVGLHYLVRDINTIPFVFQGFQHGTKDSSPDGLANVNGTLFFAANDGVTGAELWRSDGTEVGTVQVRDIQAGAIDSSPM